MATFAEPEKRQRMSIKDKIGSAFLKMTGREEQYLWREEMQHAALKHGDDLPFWDYKWDVPKEEERDPLLLCRQMLDLADGLLDPSKPGNEGVALDRVGMSAEEELLRLQSILFVLTGCSHFDAARFCGPEYRSLFHEGLSLDDLRSNATIEHRAAELTRSTAKANKGGDVLPGLLLSWLLAAVRGGNTQPLSPTVTPTVPPLQAPNSSSSTGGPAEAEAMEVDSGTVTAMCPTTKAKAASHSLRGNLTTPATLPNTTTVSCSKAKAHHQAVETAESEPLASPAESEDCTTSMTGSTGAEAQGSPSTSTPLHPVLLAPPMLLALGVVLALGPANCLA